jgi:hypothetical protein
MLPQGQAPAQMKDGPRKIALTVKKTFRQKPVQWAKHATDHTVGKKNLSLADK